MSVALTRYQAEDLATPFEVVDYDVLTQTGGDWYATMLSASLGGKDIEGAAFSGTSEVLMKVDYEFAAKKATGKVKIICKNKEVEALDEAGRMVAKLGKKFRGVTKANNFSLVTEDTLWSSAGMNRIRSASFFAASLVAMGLDSYYAADIASEILGETLPPEIMEAVVVPLSVLKRDAAVLAKGRNAVFIPHHLIQDVVWEDGSLVMTSQDSAASIDWGRVTAIAKYIGMANSLADPRFEQLASLYGVPYALVNDHWAFVTRRPYLELSSWKALDSPSTLLSGVIEDAAAIAETLIDNTMLQTRSVMDISESTTAGELMKALSAVRKKKRAPVFSPATDVLAPVTAHSVKASDVGITVLGADSAHNAVKSAQIAKAKKTPGMVQKLAVFLTESRKFAADEGEMRKLVKEIADVLVTQDVFEDALARLTATLKESMIASTRMARYKRTVLKNSSAFRDRFKLSAQALDDLIPPLLAVARGVVEGKTGFLYPPPILANPAAAIRSGEVLQLVKEASMYLDKVKAYWGSRYQARASALAEADKPLSVKYGMAASAVRHLKAEWLMNDGNAFLPVECLDQTYIARAVEAYVRKRSCDKPKVKPMANESAMAYAKRMDALLEPRTSFVESMAFVTEKLTYIAKDFNTTREWAELEEEFVAPAPLAPLADAFADLFAAPTISLKPTGEATRATWDDNGDADQAAIANGYESFAEAFRQIGDKAAFDKENEFTHKYLVNKHAMAEAQTSAGDLAVI